MLCQIDSFRVAVRGGCAVAACAFAAAAMAQESGIARSSLVLEEVIVTAQKRRENLQDVPASISVIGGQQLEELSATSLNDYAAYIPGLNIESRGVPGTARVSLRGLPTLSGANMVGTYIDDAPIGFGQNGLASAFSLDLMPYDIERIEVLRGPQGTLYGASTMGGLLKYVMRSPQLENFEARVGAEISTLEHAADPGWGARAAVNVPLVEGRLAMRASYFQQRTPGYIDNRITGAKDENDYIQEGGRVSLLWQASETLSLRLSAMIQDIEADGNGQIALDPATFEPLVDDHTSSHFAPETFQQEQRYYSATLNWDLGWAAFTSATSYNENTTTADGDNTIPFRPLVEAITGGAVPDALVPQGQILDLEKFTQEFRLASPSGGKFEWLVGAFYDDENDESQQNIILQDASGTPLAIEVGPGIPLNPFAAIEVPVSYSEYAAFGSVTYRFTERFDVTAGGRWAHNENEFQQFLNGTLFILLAGGESTNVGVSEEDVTTYMFSPRFHVSEDTMVYGRVASSYRPGGPNPAFPGVPSEFNADELVSYELGLKSQFLGGRALLNAAVFYIDWEDIQISVPSPDGRIQIGANGGTAESQGVELSAGYSPLQGLQLGLNAAYTDATLSEDVPSLDGLSGDRLPMMPEWSASFTANYEFPVAQWMGRVGAGYRFVDERDSLLAGPRDPTNLRFDSYQMVDLHTALSNDRWTVRLFVKNLTEEVGYTDGALLTDGPALNAAPLLPRTIGASVDVKF